MSGRLYVGLYQVMSDKYFGRCFEMKKERRATLRFHEKQWQALEKIAKGKKTSVSQQIRKAVEGHIANQKSPNSLSLMRKQMAQRTILEKTGLAGSLLLAAFTIVCFNDIKMGLLRQITMSSGITLAFLALFYNNLLKRYWEKITIVVVDTILVISLSIFWFFPSDQSLIGTIFTWFFGGLIATFFTLFIIFKICGSKID